MARKTSAGLNVDRLDQMIKDLGVRIRLFKSTICPNLKSLESMDHDLNCKLCKNHMIDFAPKETVIMFQQQDLVEQYKVHGTFHIDEAMASFLSGETLVTFARIDLLDFKEDFTELIVRQVGQDVDILKYPACEIVAIFTATGPTTREEYYPGSDFKVNVNGDVEWIGTHKPADKKVYTVYYKFHPVFRAIKAAHRDRYTQYNIRIDKIKAPKIQVGDATYVKGPETWILKRDYLLEREDKTGARIATNEDYDPNA